MQQVGLPRTKNINPANYPNEAFELYSVPAYSAGEPDIVLGANIGSTKQIVEVGDVLLCKIVPHLNRVWVVPPKRLHRQIASGEWIVIRSSEHDPSYIRHALMEPGFREKFMDTVSGVGGSLLRARPQLVSQIRITLAPPVEQREIVDKLESLLAKSKVARQELDRVPKLVERYKQAMLSAAFRGDLTAEWRTRCGVEQKATWATGSVGSVLSDCRYGTAKKCHYEPLATPVLRIPNVAAGRIDTKDLKFGQFDESEIRKLSLEPGDLLVIRSNGSPDLVGRVALATDQVQGFLFAGYLIRLRPNRQRVLPEFLAYAFEEPSARSVIQRFAKSTSGVNNINSEQIRSLKVPLPSLPEQEEIVLQIRKANAVIAGMAAEAARAAALISRLEKAKLSKVFENQLAAS